MEGFTAFLSGFGAWTLYALWAASLLGVSLLVYLGLGGNFFILGLAVVHGLVTGFDPLGPRLLGLLLLIAVVGEVIEFLLGLIYVSRKGATRHGVSGAFLGGLLGAVVGNGALPVVGAIFGSFVGAFLGAVLGEYLRVRRMGKSVRVGWHAFVGKMLAIFVKHALGLVMIWLILVRTAPL